MTIETNKKLELKKTEEKIILKFQDIIICDLQVKTNILTLNANGLRNYAIKKYMNDFNDFFDLGYFVGQYKTKWYVIANAKKHDFFDGMQIDLTEDTTPVLIDQTMTAQYLRVTNRTVRAYEKEGLPIYSQKPKLYDFRQVRKWRLERVKNRKK